MRKKKGKVIIGLLLVLAVVYLVAGVVIPYRHQPEVSGQFKEELDLDSFYSEQVSSDRAMVIGENDMALDERIRMIAGAEENIILSTFCFQSDESGKEVLAALLNAAGRGVKISILADGFNSIFYMDRNPYFYALAAEENVEIKIYNKVNLLTPWTSMGRMHDKYLIVDDLAYVLGGRNTFNYFLGDYGGTTNHDWDVLVCNSQGKGSASSVYQLKQYFYDIWKLDVCKPFLRSEKAADKKKVKQAGQELEKRYQEMQEEKPELFSPYNYVKVTYPADKITLVSGPTHIKPKEPQVFYTLIQLMKNARQEVYMHTPYMVCNDKMYEAFEAVAEAIGEFKVLTNSAENNGNLFAAGDYLINRERLLETGMKIWEYEGGISYHGKCMIIDDDISVVGSFNMDMRSTYLNTEQMLVIDSEALNAELRKQMEVYEAKALQVADEGHYIEKDGIVKEEMPVVKGIMVRVVRFVVGWARFLI